MMKYKSLLSVVSILMSTTYANADAGFAFDGAMSLSYSNFNTEGFATNQIAFNLVSDIKFSDKLSLGLDVDHGRLSANGTTANLERIQLEPTVVLANGSYAGAYYQDASVDVYIFGVSLESYGVFGGYDAKSWALDGYIGKSKLDLGNDVTSNNFGATFTLRPNEKLDVFGHFAQGSPSDNISSSETISVTAIGGEYRVKPGLMTYAAFERFQVSGQHADGYAVGAGYDLSSNGSKLPGTVTVEVGKIGASYVDQTNVTVGWLIPLGNGKLQPLSSMVRTARGGIRSPLVAAFGSMGGFGSF